VHAPVTVRHGVDAVALLVYPGVAALAAHQLVAVARLPSHAHVAHLVIVVVARGGHVVCIEGAASEDAARSRGVVAATVGAPPALAAAAAAAGVRLRRRATYTRERHRRRLDAHAVHVLHDNLRHQPRGQASPHQEENPTMSARSASCLVALARARVRGVCLWQRSVRVHSDARPGIHQSPIVDALWSSRSTSTPSHAAAATAPLRVPPSSSRLSVEYNFGGDAELRDRYRNPWGKVRVCVCSG
jgi:hypothetical protein